MIRSIPLFLASAFSLVAASPAGSAAQLVAAWTASGFDLPESVSFDPGSNAFYVVNLGKDPMARDGNGFISKLSADGRVEKLKWVDGLNAPKGSEIVGDKLYVTDLDVLVEIDLNKAQVLNRYPVPDAKLLNDVAAATDGRVYIADTMANAIYLFENGAVTEWLQDPALDGPNGLVIDGSNLLVSSLGDITKGFENIKPSNVKRIDLVTKEIKNFGSAAPIGNLDGIERTGDGGVTVTDNPKGLVFQVKPGERAVELGKVKPGAADHEYAPSMGLLIIPEMSDNTVVAYQWGG